MKSGREGRFAKTPRPYLAMALGTNEATPLQVASAYTALPTSEHVARPWLLTASQPRRSDDCCPTTQKNEFLRPDVAYVMNSLLKDASSTACTAAPRARTWFESKCGGQTGTSRDGWFAGFTQLVCVVWVGSTTLATGIDGRQFGAADLGGLS